MKFLHLPVGLLPSPIAMIVCLFHHAELNSRDEMIFFCLFPQ